MKIVPYIFLFLITGCATKYLMPGNRFITPETQGGIFRGQAEIHKTKANKLEVDGTTGSPNSGVNYEDLERLGFLISTSLFDRFDFLWSHVGGGPSLLGGKVQVIGDSRSAKAAGHKAAIAYAVGGNEHEDEDHIMDFELMGSEFLGSYGYRFSEFIMPYGSLSFANYNFDGKFHQGSLAGDEAEFKTKIVSLNAGVELAYQQLFLKIEYSNQRTKTSGTDLYTRKIYGVSLGLSW